MMPLDTNILTFMATAAFMATEVSKVLDWRIKIYTFSLHQVIKVNI